VQSETVNKKQQKTKQQKQQKQQKDRKVFFSLNLKEV